MVIMGVFQQLSGNVRKKKKYSSLVPPYLAKIVSTKASQ